MAALRGLLKHQEQDQSQLIRDTRTLGQNIHDFLEDPRHGAIILLFSAVVIFVFPGVADLVFIINLFFFWYSFYRHPTLPFRMPMRSRSPDYNDPLPGSARPRMARGICFYGNEIQTQSELWFNNDDMRTHALIFGSTGSGKTEALVSLAFNGLVHGSGFIYVDGKGDNSLYAKVFSMVRGVGREDDMLLINFMTGARDIIGPQEKRLSNTMNPFCNGSSSMLSQLVVGLMGSSGQSSDGDMWKGRAISFVEALMKILVYMRDQNKILLDAGTIRDYFGLAEYLEPIVIDRVFPRKNQESVSLADVPEEVMDPLYNYVVNLPGYNKEKKGKQVSQVLEQHGFITMQLTRVFGSLADTYGHILKTNLAEVDLKDVVLNRRILVVLLPALEKAPEELSNLGKIIIASLKAMMAAGLGEDVEGDYRDIVLRKPTNSPTPYMCILDEYGYYAVQGFAVVPAQARSLGFSVIFAGQDLPAFQKASKEEAASIGANTNIKIAMKLEDPHETWDFFAKTAGESYVTKVDSFQTSPDNVFNNYLDARSASAEKRARIDLLDLKNQREGEAHIFFKSTIVRARMFFADPKPVSKLRLNHFLKVEAPSSKDLREAAERQEKFMQLLQKKEMGIPAPEASEEIDFVAKVLREDESSTLIERGVAALLAFYDGIKSPAEQKEEEEIQATGEEAQEEKTILDIFSKVHLPDLVSQLISEKEIETFSMPLLKRGKFKTLVNLVSRLTGQSKDKAQDTADELLNNMAFATTYPPAKVEKIEADEVARSVKEIVKILSEKEASGDSGLF